LRKNLRITYITANLQMGEAMAWGPLVRGRSYCIEIEQEQARLTHERFKRQSGDCRQHPSICYPAMKQSNTRHQREELGEQFA